jgi:hypothetical protein
LLEDDLGDSICAVWLPDEVDQRWYLFPAGSSWNSLLGWVVDKGIPGFVPGAAARVRSLGVVEERMLTASELQALDALASFEERTTVERSELESDLALSRADAQVTRDSLLYGVGDDLKSTVF